MKYMGGKFRLAKHIMPIILEGRQAGQHYVEPFVGGGNTIQHAECPRIGADANIHTINALKFVRDHADKVPKNNSEYTKAEYDAAMARHRVDKAAALTGRDSLAGFAYSFGAKMFGGWASGRDGRDYVSEACHNAQKQSSLLQACELIHSSYNDLAIPPRSVIYCDPPYAGTTSYIVEFNSDDFWQWCREKVTEGHQVYVSEYAAPADFVCVFEKTQAVSIAKQAEHHTHKIERLFVHESQSKGNK